MGDINKEEVERINRLYEAQTTMRHPVISLLLLVLTIVAFGVLTGCALEQTVMVSRGEAGGLSEAFGGQAQYCKITASDGIEITESDRAAFRTYCAEGD